MRKLITADMFACVRLLKRIGLREAIKAAADDEIQSGEDLFWLIFECAGRANAEREVYEFLSPIVGKTPDELSQLPIDEFFGLFGQLAEENDLRGFFAKAVRLTRPN